ncbi:MULTISPECIES: hypothetical protein [unclassified Chryseobacterium]|uniref:FEKKY domain-containing protein n=1 Tax=unclassified Chryseobacterium TaxID=2593645 RepID=UPI000F449E19|nr:hypothetical protein [Chryseobacterium sp. G0240]ROI01782.1 hypothetical protein EGI16_15880 [Chryseobacterium sp. G0240]
MDRKLIYINIILIPLLITVYILEYYVINYPLPLRLRYVIEESRLEYLAVILGITALVSYLISSLDIKKLSFGSKFLRIFPLINFIVFIFFIYLSVDGWIEKQNELSKIENSYIRQAKKDIRNDKVILGYAGGLSLSPPQQHQNKIDSIHKKYGICYKNRGCISDPMDIKAQEKYTKIVIPYLEKRNGKGWENRMQKEINGLKNIP